MNKRKKAQKTLSLLLKIVIPAIISLVICEFPLENVEGFLFDLRARTKPTSPMSGNIELIKITKNTIDKLSSEPQAEHYTQVLKRLSTYNPKAIVISNKPPNVEGSENEKKEYAKTAEALPYLYFSGKTDDYRQKALTKELFFPPPYDKLKITMGTILRNITLGSKDKVARRIAIEFHDQTMLIPKLAQLINPDRKTYQGQFKLVNFTNVYIDYRPTGSYPATDFIDLLEDGTDLKRFTDKIVFIGDDAQADDDNYIFTTLSRDITAMSRLEGNANALDTLLLNRGALRPPKWVDQTIASIVSIITLYAVMTFNPLVGILTLAILSVLFTLICYLFLTFGMIWIGMAHPLLTIFICYYFTIPYRLIVENRRSWEYYQKHRLLKQVEELKTNFLSMMSHDIKTPIARIQGMSEIILSEKEKLSSQQSESLTTIQSSAEELSGFISTVLDLGRIENQKVELKRTGKDINALLDEVIQKHEFLAKEKNIQIIREFETLFSLKIDIELVRQVFANLIENAIKYSPRDSKILISTEETDEKIIIQIADQGVGIPADEIESIFMKFYRSKDAKSSSTKGSGLGLYLANYFIELHGGQLTAESTLGQGSTFTVELPSS